MRTVLIGYLQTFSEHNTKPGAHRQALADAGCGQVVEEQTAAKDSQAQPELDSLLRRLQPGDVLVVPQLDSLGQSLPDLAGILRRIAATGAGLRSLAGLSMLGRPRERRRMVHATRLPRC